MRFTIGTNKAGTNTANTFLWQFRAITNRIELLELGLSVEVSPTTGPAFRLNRTTALGTQTAQVTPVAEDPDVTAALGRVDTTWSANPTAAGTDMRRYACPNAIGSGIVWTWYDKPLRIPAAGGLAVINANATGTTLGTFSLYAIFDE